MLITDIYKKYHIPNQLQLHMLRVAACANLILDNWENKEINKKSILKVCLLHDMGNIAKIKDNPDNDEEFIKIRNKYVEEFGTDDHLISLQIMQYCRIKPEDINDSNIEKYINELKKIDIIKEI